MILSRFSIRGKLNILLMLALAAVLLVSIPFVAGQVEQRAVGRRTADTARNARELGEPDLGAAARASRHRGLPGRAERQQRELGGSSASVDSAAAQVQVGSGSKMSDELATALVRLGSLQELRQSALRAGISPDSVARTYHAVIGALDRRTAAGSAADRRRRGHQAAHRARCAAARQRVQRPARAWR